MIHQQSTVKVVRRVMSNHSNTMLVPGRHFRPPDRAASRHATVGHHLKMLVRLMSRQITGIGIPNQHSMSGGSIHGGIGGNLFCVIFY
jgi:hypothetical protein